MLTMQENDEELAVVTQKVLTAIGKSKRAGVKGQQAQIKIIQNCKDEISKCENLHEIEKSLGLKTKPSNAKKTRQSAMSMSVASVPNTKSIFQSLQPKPSINNPMSSGNNPKTRVDTHYSPY